jgi:uncharacterized membrane protein YeaQ/YmgE (transglycosylase-associated protein family)
MIIGGLGGWIAGMVTNRRHNIFVNIIVGLVGASIAKWLLDLVGVAYSGWPPRLGVAVLGAALLLFVLGLIGRKTI